MDALKAGGGDYVTKPVGRQEFLARIEAALRRATVPPIQVTSTVYADPFLSVDFARHKVYARGTLVHPSVPAAKPPTLCVNQAGT